ncbi:ATP binding protein [Heracleum sosnowskyi]|uniref:ATP binding protein n=1 Tax=Heracleum sosnowskyi TaxID=360622 RepID=A0AAD8M4J1_9APIA|nr:ATP binding protein [Heracleum sosnowskyi]
MDKIYEELEDAKAEMETLRADNRAKGQLSESLRRANDKQLVRIQEISKQLETQRQVSNEKDHELSEMRQMLEEIKCNLNEKQGTVTRLSYANDKLRTSHAEEISKYEEEKRELAFKLEEESAKNVDNEKKIRRLEEAIEGLKGVLSVSQKKRAGADADAEELGKTSSEVRYKDDILLKSEDENRELKDQLKRKREQFEHLKEAHERLRDQLRTNTKEWEKEKSAMLDEIDAQQDKLDSQTRILKDLRSRLQMCNQALAHEESRRKSLEVQLLESKTWIDSVSTECEEAKTKLECLSGKRDKDVATLRDLLGTKETLYRELEYKIRRLEQDDQELKLSLKEFQEAQIKQAGSSSSMSKLRNKLKCLEQTYTDCSAKFKIKEAKWISEKEKLMKDLTCCRSEQEGKGELIKELNMELEGCHSLIMQLMMQIEESSIMLLVLQSEIKEAQLKLSDRRDDVEKEECLSFLKQQLEMKDSAIVAALNEVEEGRIKVESLSRKIESFNLIEEQQFTLKNDLDNHKKMVVDSFTCQQHLKDQVLQLKGDLNRVHDALDKANEELAQKFYEVKEAEYEIQVWGSIAERLKIQMEENYQLRQQVEASLLEQVSVEVTLEQEKEDMVHMLEEKDRRVNHLLQKVQSMEEELKLKESVAQMLEEKERKIDDLQSKIVSLDQKLQISEDGAGTPARRARPLVKKECNISESEVEWWDKEWLSKELETTIFAQFDAHKIYEHENKKLYKLVDEKSQKIVDFHKHVNSLEQEFENSSSSFSSLLLKLQAETTLFHEVQEKFTTTMVLKELEIQYKNLMIAELENDSSHLQQELELQEKLLSTSIQGRDNHIGAEMELFDRFSKLYNEDMQLVQNLEGIVQNIDDYRKGRDNEDYFDPVKENLIISPSPMKMKIEKPALMISSSPSTDGRSPLSTLNRKLHL